MSQSLEEAKESAMRQIVNDVARFLAPLFLPTGDTGKKDINGTPIMVGSTLRDHSGLSVVVYEVSPKVYHVAVKEEEASTGPSLNLWLSMSQTIEVVKKDLGPDNNNSI